MLSSIISSEVELITLYVEKVLTKCKLGLGFNEVVLLFADKLLNHSEQSHFDLSGPREPMLEN